MNTNGVYKNKEVSKSFANLSVKIGEKKGIDLEDGSDNSDLSGDEWTEIVRYERERYEEDK